jgi:hypothetical protein
MIDIRRVFTHVEDIFHEFGPPAAQPLRRGFIGAVLANPFAGRYEADILPMMEALRPSGRDGAPPARGHGGAGRAHRRLRQGRHRGRRRRAGARRLWHVPGGYAMRELLGWSGDRVAYMQGRGEAKTGQPGNALAIVPSTKKVGPPGCTLDVP